MGLRYSDRLALLLLLLVVLSAAALLHAGLAERSAVKVRERNCRLVSRLRLTDLCLTTEASYTRNPALADRYTAFQDHPAALEHFPSGALITPPPHY